MTHGDDANYVLTLDCFEENTAQTIKINKKQFDNSFWSRNAMGTLARMGKCVCTDHASVLAVLSLRVLARCLDPKRNCNSKTDFVAHYIENWRRHDEIAAEAIEGDVVTCPKDFNGRISDCMSIWGMCRGHNSYQNYIFDYNVPDPDDLDVNVGFDDDESGTTPKTTSKPSTPKPSTQKPTQKPNSKPTIPSNLKPGNGPFLDLSATASHLNVDGSPMRLSMVPRGYPFCIQPFRSDLDW